MKIRRAKLGVIYTRIAIRPVLLERTGCYSPIPHL
jgi:hypothetical protein